ncbi:MAG: hypothetical protein V3R63_05720, partial [Alphaproteobacteria bacterium]
NLRRILSDKSGQRFGPQRTVFRDGKFFAMRTANIGQNRKTRPPQPPVPSPARREPHAAHAPENEGIRHFQGTGIKKTLREQLNQQLKRRLKEYYEERQRLPPRP